LHAVTGIESMAVTCHMHGPLGLVLYKPYSCYVDNIHLVEALYFNLLGTVAHKHKQAMKKPKPSWTYVAVEEEDEVDFTPTMLSHKRVRKPKVKL